MSDGKKKGATPLRLIDVGGQQSERRKWLSVFKDVNCVIYLVYVSPSLFSPSSFQGLFQG